ncbi:hypothetical protein ACT3SP_14390 [Brachybacterium sp. AOP43-C2-M15]|uniref:hypothetical protein n=1 Tax=Brachybacterium sp. AOP43-C2-M15 TaxID=3457661 RepID=UPI004033333F
MTTHTAHGPRRIVALLAILGALVLAAMIGGGLLGGPSQDPAPTAESGPSHGGRSDDGGEDPGPTGSPEDPDPSPAEGPGASDSPVPNSVERTAECPEATTTVEDAGTLRTALESARPGDVIRLAPGTYEGEFTARTAGTEDAPITLCGGQDAVLDGGDPDGGYTLHLDGASHWHVLGFRVTGGQKGVMVDDTEHSVIEGLTVSDIGDEAIHLRTHSSHNIVVGNHVSGTGLREPKFGEGIYIGSAESNWEDLTDGEPDTSDENLIEDNRIEGVTAEAVDIKEGTTGGILRNNSFDGSAITGDGHADSWVDVKGNDWIIEGNTGTASPADGFQTHEILDGWGTGNVFRHNTADLADMTDDGHGFSLTPELENVVECSNEVSGTDQELANTPCVEDASTP